jgi:DNA integrity scanning protein DisA with diadenylate cyclase activity
MDTITTIQSLLKCNGSAQPVTVALMPNEARLIAAAPDLYAALKHALGIIVEFGDLNGFRNMSDEELGRAVKGVAENAAAALNKAEARRP